jgi:hypothetical protein
LIALRLETLQKSNQLKQLLNNPALLFRLLEQAVFLDRQRVATIAVLFDPLATLIHGDFSKADHSSLDLISTIHIDQW